ncbi:hypothetical protein PoB_002944000 [Plakobranchus ocellatus]|uniref:Uncharacterized protein n=1 Tax=Plakobranchus ocellatus TaxID=259542 RepID=A0AAV4A484_9GAST|nr:hypothetical protein PoB_002944000 [Plakobranchus ocellatus]
MLNGISISVKERQDVLIYDFVSAALHSSCHSLPPVESCFSMSTLPPPPPLLFQTQHHTSSTLPRSVSLSSAHILLHMALLVSNTHVDDHNGRSGKTLTHLYPMHHALDGESIEKVSLHKPVSLIGDVVTGALEDLVEKFIDKVRQADEDVQEIEITINNMVGEEEPKHLVGIDASGDKALLCGEAGNWNGTPIPTKTSSKRMRRKTSSSYQKTKLSTFSLTWYELGSHKIATFKMQAEQTACKTRLLPAVYSAHKRLR